MMSTFAAAASMMNLIQYREPLIQNTGTREQMYIQYSGGSRNNLVLSIVCPLPRGLGLCHDMVQSMLLHRVSYLHLVGPNRSHVNGTNSGLFQDKSS